jgi:hypothetical protein
LFSCVTLRHKILHSCRLYSEIWCCSSSIFLSVESLCRKIFDVLCSIVLLVHFITFVEQASTSDELPSSFLLLQILVVNTVHHQNHRSSSKLEHFVSASRDCFNYYMICHSRNEISFLKVSYRYKSRWRMNLPVRSVQDATVSCMT